MMVVAVGLHTGWQVGVGGRWGFSCGVRPISHNCEKKGMIDEGQYE